MIVREFMEESIKDPTGTLPGKSIIFAISKAHARRVEEIFDRLYPEHRGRLARVIVSEDPRVYGKGGLLDQFKTRDMPRVAISVDMLDTGIDVLEIVNLVFAKPVYSYTKFWQMIGRGTRLLHTDPTKRRAWCVEKDRFLIIDCWGNFDFFGLQPRGVEPGVKVALPVRLFRSRLQKLAAAISAGNADVVERVKRDLRADLADLPANNVVVLEAAAVLAEVRLDRFWVDLGDREIAHLKVSVAPVLRARSAADSKGLLFEKDVVDAGTALLERNEVALAAARDGIVEQVAELPLTVNLVAKERALIDQALDPAWWSDPTDEKLEELRIRLSPLMRFRQRRRDAIMRLDVADLIAIKELVEFGPSHERLSTAAYRERVEKAVRDLVAVNPVLQRIQAGEPVTEADIEELASVLRAGDPWVTEELLRKIYDNRMARFEQFMRHILGLEMLESWPAMVTREFDAFIAAHSTLSAIQIRFLQTLRTFVLQTRRLEKRNLVEAPFTQIHPDGVRGVFRPGEIDELMTLAGRLVA